MSKRERRLTGIVTGIVAALVVTALFWLGGFNFDHRGETAVFWFLTVLVAGGGVGTMVWAVTCLE